MTYGFTKFPNTWRISLARVRADGVDDLIGDEIENFSFAHDGGNCWAIGFFCMCVAFEVVKFLDAFFSCLACLFSEDGLKFTDAGHDGLNFFEQFTGADFG